LVKKDLKSRRKLGVVNCLLKDPTQGMSKIAEKTKMHRRTAWQIQKELEKDNTIWGYTTVIDEQKIDNVIYVAQFRIKPMNKDFVDLVIKRLTMGEPTEEGVRIIDMFYMNGDYDVLIKFSAPDHATARKYHETLRTVYKNHFLETPRVSDVNFLLVQEGKLNPELEKLYDFVPKITAE
jgi:DNA-binding Lrp family transcriptional regulator